MSDTMTPTPPGWYEDPWGTASWRYWDGSEWTEHTSGADQSDASEASEAPETSEPSAPVSAGPDGWAPPGGRAPQVATPATSLTARIADVLSNRFALAGVLIGVVVLIGVLLGAVSGSDQRSVTGEFALFDESTALWLDYGDRCEGSGGYGDIHAGTQVRISDSSGEVIGKGHLGSGEIRTTAGGKACVLDFAVDGLPDSSFYTFEVSHRGELTYSRSDMEGFGWHVSLQLGG